MHAAERYEGVVDKLRECNEQLEGTKETVRELALRFEEVKKHRQDLFQVSLAHVEPVRRCLVVTLQMCFSFNSAHIVWNDACAKLIIGDISDEYRVVPESNTIFRICSPQECYQQVSRALGSIYSDLTRSSKHPTGKTYRRDAVVVCIN
jgi:hypothetical protein